MVPDGGHPAEQRLLVDLPDDEAVVPVVDEGQVGPAVADECAAALRSDRLDSHLGDDRRCAHGHAAEAGVHRWFASVQERHQLGPERVTSGRIHAPVWTTSRPGVSCHGSRIWSVASHGWSPMT